MSPRRKGQKLDTLLNMSGKVLSRLEVMQRVEEKRLKQMEVRTFANHLHTIRKYWQGEVLGWHAEYTPEKRKKPSNSKMKFTPADFWIGESGIWFFSLMWEHGKDRKPVEFLDDRRIIKDP